MKQTKEERDSAEIEESSPKNAREAFEMVLNALRNDKDNNWRQHIQTSEEAALVRYAQIDRCMKVFCDNVLPFLKEDK